MKGPMGSEVGDTHLKPGGRIHPGCVVGIHDLVVDPIEQIVLGFDLVVETDGEVL